MTNALQSNAASNNKNPQDPGKETYVVIFMKKLLFLLILLFALI